jgi:hypothetical protein
MSGVAAPTPKPAAVPPAAPRAPVPPSAIRPSAAALSAGLAGDAPQRILSIDAYRGFVMFLMMAEILHLSGIAANFPDSTSWQQVGFHTSHVEWLAARCTT